jgi:hypothetical protein
MDKKLSAVNLGFDPAWIQQIIGQYGEDVLAIVIEAARNGLSIQLVVEIFTKFGPAILQLLVDFLNKKKMQTQFAGEIVDGPVNVAVDSTLIDLLVEKYLPVIIQKYLPMIMEQYGAQLVQIFIDVLLKNFQKK